MMDSLRSTVKRLFVWRQQDFEEKSPKLLATPFSSSTSISRFNLPSSHYSSSSSDSLDSPSSIFWQSPRTPSYWSPRKYIPATVRGTVTKRQMAVITCLILALLVWIVPPPATWRKRVVHVTLNQPVSSPYQVLRPILPTVAKKHAPDPVRWLKQHSNNKHSTVSKSRLTASLTDLGHVSARPRAALISLVRNSELPGLMQSMRQLEYHWNRKYQYPWVFFNDEPFSDEFKVWY